MIIGSVAGMAQRSMGYLAFIAVAILAIGNAGGRIIAGMISDRIGRKATLLIMLSFQGVLMLIAIPIVGTATTSGIVIVILATLLGFNYGTNLSLFPSLTKDSWGLKNFGINYGIGLHGMGRGRVCHGQALSDAVRLLRQLHLLFHHRGGSPFCWVPPHPYPAGKKIR